MANENIQPLLDWPTFTGFLILAIVLIGAALVAHDSNNRRKGK